eukprot:2051427-Rhodomonas_salina.5
MGCRAQVQEGRVGQGGPQHHLALRHPPHPLRLRRAHLLLRSRSPSTSTILISPSSFLPTPLLAFPLRIALSLSRPLILILGV